MKRRVSLPAIAWLWLRLLFARRLMAIANRGLLPKDDTWRLVLWIVDDVTAKIRFRKSVVPHPAGARGRPNGRR